MLNWTKNYDVDYNITGDLQHRLIQPPKTIAAIIL